VVVAAALLVAGFPARAAHAQDGLLRGRAPSGSAGVTNPERLTDGVASRQGAFWLTDLASQLKDRRAFVEWDLGSVQPIRCLFLQGDNNDVYHLLRSEDGQNYLPLWEAGPEGKPGMRTRLGQVDARARFIRLEASGGDGSYSVDELAAWAECPAKWPPAIARRRAATPEQSAQTKTLVFVLAAAAFVLVHRRRAGRLRTLLVLAPLAAGAALAVDLVALYPFWDLEDEVRAAVAAIAAVVVLKEAFASDGNAPDPRWTRAILGILAVAAVGCYYHFGALQFWDAAKGRRTFVHTFDMRHYQPIAKYFGELRFDGLYAGSMAAYLDLNPHLTIDDVADVEFRDLETSDMRKTRELADQVKQVKARFSPARWEEFKKDMKYWLDTMGPDYLGSMRDHGGNATPVWLLPAWAIFAKAPANELTLSLAGLIDPVLLVLLFVCVYRTFGARVTLYSIILFGATDFYQFGSNLMGSTLRQDWLVAAGLGACALRAKRPFLGGFLLAYAGLIRAFPAVAALFVVVPILWYLIDRLRARRGLPGVAELRAHERPALRATAGAATAVIGLIVVTSLLFGLQGAWGNWLKKIEIHATGPSVNNVGLRNVLMFEPHHAAKAVLRAGYPEPWVDWQRHQTEAFARRRVLFYLGNALFLALALLACRGRPIEQTALLGLLTIPFLFYPSNYYCHYIFLLPLAAAARDGSDPRDRTFALGTAALLGICVGQYFTLLETWSDLRYTYQSIVLLVGSLLFVLPLAWGGWRGLRGAPAQAPAPGPGAAAPAGSA
jgi:hypothetical protein